MENKMTISVFDHIPSRQEFSNIEFSNTPAVFKGCISDWTAIAKWNPHENGLNYLEHKAGSSVVELMLSSTGSTFNGDIRSHDRISLPFSLFIRLCKKSMESHNFVVKDEDQEKQNVVEPESIEGLLNSIESTAHIYLAQVPMLSKETKADSPLEVLVEDIHMPGFLDEKTVSNINLWMNIECSTSSAHYDPYHNLLCTVAGCKQVLLWPPCTIPYLYPRAIYGEASNHISVDLSKPDFNVHPLAKHALDSFQKVCLQAGDALFLPEGWFHQVESAGMTIAVNFWWPSKIMQSMQPHMDAYYLRRITSRLIDDEKKRMLQNLHAKSDQELIKGKYSGCLFSEVHPSESADQIATSCAHQNEKEIQCKADCAYYTQDGKKFVPTQLVNDLSMQEPKKCETLHTPTDTMSHIANMSSNAMTMKLNTSKSQLSLQNLDAYESLVLNILISNVHQYMSVESHTFPDTKMRYQSAGSFEENPSVYVNMQPSSEQMDPSCNGEIVANILGHIKVATLKKVLLVMAKQFPRTLEALVLHVFTPIGIEVLTHKFEEMDNEMTRQEQEQFYQQFYSVFSDNHVALEAILNGKEQFAFMALRRVIGLNLGLDLPCIEHNNEKLR